VLREIFQPRREEVTGEWRKLHNEELYDMYTSLNVTRVVKSGRMKWHGMCNSEGRRRLGFTGRNLKE
jgi:hypothetical protein